MKNAFAILADESSKRIMDEKIKQLWADLETVLNKHEAIIGTRTECDCPATIWISIPDGYCYESHENDMINGEYCGEIVKDVEADSLCDCDPSCRKEITTDGSQRRAFLCTKCGKRSKWERLPS